LTKAIFKPPTNYFDDGSNGKCECGRWVKPDYEYCPYCGEKLNKVFLKDERPVLIALFGKSASYKDSVAKWLEKLFDNSHRVISCTTRPPRENEKDGVDYHFLSPGEFYELAEQKQLLEYTEFRGWYYGTPQNEILKDKVNIGVFNPEGIMKLRRPEYKERFRILFVELEANIIERLKRSYQRENKWRPEYFRRAFTDWNDFRKLNLSDVYPKECFDTVDMSSLDVAKEIEHLLINHYRWVE